jgi:hypothetical protein
MTRRNAITAISADLRRSGPKCYPPSKWQNEPIERGASRYFKADNHFRIASSPKVVAHCQEMSGDAAKRCQVAEREEQPHFGVAGRRAESDEHERRPNGPGGRAASGAHLQLPCEKMGSP